MTFTTAQMIGRDIVICINGLWDGTVLVAHAENILKCTISL